MGHKLAVMIMVFKRIYLGVMILKGSFCCNIYFLYIIILALFLQIRIRSVMLKYVLITTIFSENYLIYFEIDASIVT